ELRVDGLGHGHLLLRLLPNVGWSGVAGGTRTLIAGVAPRDPVPLNDDHMLISNGRPGGTLTPVSRVATAYLDPRPPGAALPGRCCQGGARTPAFRLTAGRLAVRPPGTETTYRDGDSNPGFRIDGPALPLAELRRQGQRARPRPRTRSRPG